MTRTPAPERHVLVVDDVMLNRKLVVVFLSRMGWQCHEVDGGLPALEWLASHPKPDLMLLDISMPDLDGEAVCHQVRAMPALAGLKIVAYTAHASSQDSERFLANGFDEVLIKPISMQRIKEVMHDLFGL